MVRPTINSEKHFHPVSLQTVAGQSITNLNIAVAVASPGAQNEVRVGALVKAVYIELWYIGSSTQPVIQTSTFEKISSDGPNMTQPQSQGLHTYPNKKNIFYTTQGVVGDANTNPAPLFKQWIAVPKGKQRMGLGDSLVLNVAALGEVDQDLEICGMTIYKEYY